MATTTQRLAPAVFRLPVEKIRSRYYSDSCASSTARFEAREAPVDSYGVGSALLRGDFGFTALHQTPRAGEVEACKPWLGAELEAVRPSALLALGATAARALFGPSLRVTHDRGRLIESPLAPYATLTVHPSAILRVRDRGEREDAFAGLVEDLRFLIAAAEQK